MDVFTDVKTTTRNELERNVNKNIMHDHAMELFFEHIENQSPENKIFTNAFPNLTSANDMFQFMMKRTTGITLM